MSKRSQQQVANLLAVLGIGAYSGVMLAIGLGLGRYWLSLSSDAFVAWFTPNFWFLLPTIAVTLPVALLGTLWSFVLSLGTPQASSWRLALTALVLTIVVTLAYHLPSNLRIWSGELTERDVANALVGWLVAHTLRVGGALFAGGVAFRASTKAA